MDTSIDRIAVPLCAPKPSNNRSEQARINGRRSRGPVTAAGKARSSRNAIKHGLLAKKLAPLCSGAGELADYKGHYANLVAEFDPQSPLEYMHIETVAADYVKLARVGQMLDTLMKNSVPDDTELPVVSSNEAKAAHARYTDAINAIKTGVALDLTTEDQQAIAKQIVWLCRQDSKTKVLGQMSVSENKDGVTSIASVFANTSRTVQILSGGTVVGADERADWLAVLNRQAKAALAMVAQAAADEHAHEHLCRSSMDPEIMNITMIERLTVIQAHIRRCIRQTLADLENLCRRPS